MFQPCFLPFLSKFFRLHHIIEKKICQSQSNHPRRFGAVNKEKTRNPTISGLKSGGDKRDRTADLLNAIQALSQLSYTPIFTWSVVTDEIHYTTISPFVKGFLKIPGHCGDFFCPSARNRRFSGKISNNSSPPACRPPPGARTGGRWPSASCRGPGARPCPRSPGFWPGR